MNYSSHGHLELEWKANILVCKPSGSINFQGAQKFHKLIDESINKKQPLRWARIEYFIDPNTAGTPDSYELLIKHLKQNVRQGCIFVGLVKSNSIETHYFGKTLDSIGLPWMEFQSLSGALDYISNRYEDILIDKSTERLIES